MTPTPGDVDPSLAARRSMVRDQLVARGIRDVRVLRAMEGVKRQLFVPAELEDFAYDDRALPIGLDQTISQPYVVASMLEFLEIEEGDRVLDIGTGSGYQAALLAQLAERVDSIERLAPLATQARLNLTRAGVETVAVHTGDGSLGFPQGAPYEAIVVGAGAPDVPDALLEQLAQGGRLVVPIGPRAGQTLKIIRRQGDSFEIKSSFSCTFVPLRGEQGWAQGPQA
jgi:protein-L-isoaspartate(D-aspartate) O-methyltransferase